MDDRKTAIRIVANLGQRVRRARRSLRRLKRIEGCSEEQIQHARTCENEAWNAFQASKQILNQTWGQEEPQKKCRLCGKETDEYPCEFGLMGTHRFEAVTE